MVAHTPSLSCSGQGGRGHRRVQAEGAVAACDQRQVLVGVVGPPNVSCKPVDVAVVAVVGEVIVAAVAVAIVEQVRPADGRWRGHLDCDWSTSSRTCSTTTATNK